MSVMYGWGPHLNKTVHVGCRYSTLQWLVNIFLCESTWSYTYRRHTHLRFTNNSSSVQYKVVIIRVFTLWRQMCASDMISVLRETLKYWHCETRIMLLNVLFHLSLRVWPPIGFLPGDLAISRMTANTKDSCVEPHLNLWHKGVFLIYWLWTRAES